MSEYLSSDGGSNRRERESAMSFIKNEINQRIQLLDSLETWHADPSITPDGYLEEQFCNNKLFAEAGTLKMIFKYTTDAVNETEQGYSYVALSPHPAPLSESYLMRMGLLEHKERINSAREYGCRMATDYYLDLITCVSETAMPHSLRSVPWRQDLADCVFTDRALSSEGESFVTIPTIIPGVTLQLAYPNDKTNSTPLRRLKIESSQQF